MTININNAQYEVSESDLDTKLMHFLREELDLTGTKNGCAVGACGACTVLIDGKAVRACLKKVKDVVGKQVLTIEGLLSPDGEATPLQQAFIDHGAVQCGFCTPGMVMAAHALLLTKPRPDREDIRKAIRPNLCRCTGYKQIIDAIQAAASHYG